jgi:large subunit ribosomal protein L18
MINKSRLEQRRKVKTRIRKKIRGTAERPRMVVYRSLSHLYVQVVDDASSKTIVACSTLSKDVKSALSGSEASKGRMTAAKTVGVALAKKALEKNIREIVFDRNGYRYHGVVKSLADGAREGGLKF